MSMNMFLLKLQIVRLGSVAGKCFFVVQQLQGMTTSQKPQPSSVPERDMILEAGQANAHS